MAPSKTAETPLQIDRRASVTALLAPSFYANGRTVRADVRVGGTGFGPADRGRVTRRIRGDVWRNVTADLGADCRVRFVVTVPASARRLQVTASAANLVDYQPSTSATRTLRR